ncbi:hypothetical protein BDE36_1357 [Arcticibacter tournemirensis]|uniref:Uncharacterized protein n=1 Tax=Arcticibacter tournemirensis TaxID=699437 RepID=A0A5M9GK70_9SPHI|nr:hypothetical protein [Arcticibacter tournemirensis]KAA8474171.1 hypothetical protein F1649_22335 [Arcticibacter tournemirensis]TQM49635.1 hypothetical protein BDE36_1357 [Arcticibacter tournemirensis]
MATYGVFIIESLRSGDGFDRDVLHQIFTFSLIEKIGQQLNLLPEKIWTVQTGVIGRTKRAILQATKAGTAKGMVKELRRGKVIRHLS